jgi:hypothetical protein
MLHTGGLRPCPAEENRFHRIWTATADVVVHVGPIPRRIGA